jgi:hypothetical protein
VAGMVRILFTCLQSRLCALCVFVVLLLRALLHRRSMAWNQPALASLCWVQSTYLPLLRCCGCVMFACVQV